LPFTVDELKKLLTTKPDAKPERHAISTTLPWLSWIAAYSGMRLNEICSLKVADLKREAGVWYFDVTDAAAGDRVPPEADRPRSTLTTLAYCGDGWLLPALKASGPKAPVVYAEGLRPARKLGVVRIDDAGRDRVDFHSFRRSVIACFEERARPQSEAAQVVGHERAGITFSVTITGARNWRAS
jgi:integrase